MTSTNTKTMGRQTEDPESEDPSADRASSDGAERIVADAEPEDAADGADRSSDGGAAKRSFDEPRDRRRFSISVSARGIIYAALLAILIGSTSTLAWLYIGARSEVDARNTRAANDAHAESVALTYAVNAATMNFQDLNAWKSKLVAGTSPELNDKLTKAAESMQQILVPLQWTSTAQPLVAKVHSAVGGTYIVDCFVSVQTKTVQAADGLESTATYSLTLDSNKAWQITDVGGIGSLVGQR